MHTTKYLLGLQRLLAVVLVLTSILSLGTGSVLAQTPAPDAAPQNTLSGKVLLDGGGVPAGANVVAWHGARFTTAAVQEDGSYSLTLGAGDWMVTVNPGLPGVTSPTWVYTGGLQSVSFTANPDPVNPSQTIDFTVTAADGVITGKLVAPGGSTNFSDPNRVWVRAENQEGTGNAVMADPVTGAFSINVLPGNILVKLAFQNDSWAAPITLSGSQWLVSSGSSTDVGTLQLLERQARITGSVVDQAGHSIAGMPVRAWRVDGSETAQTLTDAAGDYTLWLIQGVWEVQVTPPPASPYVPAQDPQRVVLLTVTANSVQQLAVTLADVTVQGSLVDKNGAPVSGLDGRVFAIYPDGIHWPQFGPGAAITNSSFTLKLSTRVSTEYKLKASFPSTSGYTAIADVHLTNLKPGESLIVTLPVVPDNSTISGHLLDHTTGLPEIGLPGAIYGASDSGALKRAKINPLDGSYAIDTVSTDTSGHGGTFWFLHAFVDPTTGFSVLKPRNEKVFLPFNNGNGADVTANFGVAAINALLSGRVLDPQGIPVPGAKVNVVEQGSPAGLAFRRWFLTGALGRFSVPVTAGVYKVTVDFRNWIAPTPQVVTVSANETKNIGDLKFRAIDAAITGLVSYNGSPHSAFIRAYSNSGAHVISLAGDDGKYSLGVNSGDTWHIQAVSEDGTNFLKSERIPVVTVPGLNPGHNLVLRVSETLPKDVIFTFDASQDQTFTLSNGAQVIIPAGAMATSGDVTLIVRPLAELADDGGAQPVSFGYRLLAFDASHLPVDHFNSPVTLSIPFTAVQLAALGVSAENLIPSYWDVATQSWKPVPNYSLQLGSDGSGSLNLEVDHFTDYGMLIPLLPFKSFLPSLYQ